MLPRNAIYALVGASANQEKYGYKILADLLDAGYTIIPINPNETTILGQKVYPTLSAYPGKIDTVIFVVPPAVTEKVLMEVANLHIQRVRMQPGASSENAIKFCKDHNIECIYDACVMKQKEI